MVDVPEALATLSFASETRDAMLVDGGGRVVCGASGAAAIGRGLFVQVLDGTNQVEQWQRPIMMEAREGRIFELGSMGECTSLGLPWRKHVGSRDGAST